ncbi:MAG: signal peptidase I [Puniceicoccales bacterium]|jgi:signal peptidase I|nr:signal peptidase I [Puniceicoccales bacterium]
MGKFFGADRFIAFWRSRRKSVRWRRAQHKALLSWARRISNFRNDLLAKEQLANLHVLSEKLRGAIGKNLLSDGELDSAEEFLKSLGAEEMSRTFPGENGCEAMFATVVVVLILRVFFLQLFNIPTNSMWPTYRGMSFAIGDSKPGLFSSAINVKSPSKGNIYIPINSSQEMRRQSSLLPYENCPILGLRHGKWLRERCYTIFVGDTPVPVYVPTNFDFELLLARQFFPHSAVKRPIDALKNAKIVRRNGSYQIDTGKTVRVGETILQFTIIPGDIVLVDRLTPHFFPLRRGEAAVWRTDRVPALQKESRYYIKRVVGLEGDRVSIANEQLFVNGSIANFSPPMRANNTHETPYVGYRALGALTSAPVDVPADSLFVLGDHSTNSCDSRFFGAIPSSAIIGRPLLRLQFPASMKRESLD